MRESLPFFREKLKRLVELLVVPPSDLVGAVPAPSTAAAGKCLKTAGMAETTPFDEHRKMYKGYNVPLKMQSSTAKRCS